LIAIALAAGAVAGILYYAGAQRTPVVVVSRDVSASEPLLFEDLAVLAYPADAVPAGSLSDPGAAVGKVPRAPLWRGQVVLAAALASEAATFHTGLSLPSGSRAVAIPVAAGQALGGAIAPGARVDVLAVPVAGRAPAGRATEALALAALVLDVRTESGTAYGTIAARSALGPGADRIGSVVIAIDPADETRFADRIVTSTFVIALAGPR
jgi:pilus assembly protein CpaB